MVSYLNICLDTSEVYDLAFGSYSHSTYEMKNSQLTI